MLLSARVCADAENLGVWKAEGAQSPRGEFENEVRRMSAAVFFAQLRVHLLVLICVCTLTFKCARHVSCIQSIDIRQVYVAVLHK